MITLSILGTNREFLFPLSVKMIMDWLWIDETVEKMQSEYNQVPRRKVGSPSIIIWSSSLHLGLRSLLHTAASAFLLRSITHFASPYSLTHASLEFSFILATISHNISRSFICVHVVYIAFLYLSQHFHLFKVFCFPVLSDYFLLWFL